MSSLLIEKYFPDLSDEKKNQFSSLGKLYIDWNNKINVISRKDIDHLYERHVLHSLSIAKLISFKRDSKILDIGTGGGFPGIPLAIFFPEAKFHLIDSIGKKIKVVDEIAKQLKLKNIFAEQNRAEEVKGAYDFIVSRAVAPMKTIYLWTKDLISEKNNHALKNGWILLKGGDLKMEIHNLRKPVQQIPVSAFFKEDFFQEKLIIHFSP